MGSRLHHRKVSSFITSLFLIMVMMVSSGVTVGSTDQKDESQSLISRIEIRGTSNGEELWITGNQSLAHSAFLLSDPHRLVLDIPTATLAINEPFIKGEYNYIESVSTRTITDSSRDLVRVEIVMNDDYPYVISSYDQGLIVKFGEVTSGNVIETADASASETTSATQTEKNQKPSPGDAQLSEAERVYGITAPVEFKGKPIFLDLKDADILDIFRLIAEVSGFNVVVDPDVSGRITIRMDNVPWDQALEVILKNQGLGKEIEGNIMRIAFNKKLRDEHVLKMQLEDAKRKALPIESIILYLSYADINDMENSVRVFLTERGSIMKDLRVNALIVRDIRVALDNITELVRILDVRTRQVALNGQIVVTSKNFARNLGIQWGGKFTADIAHGNTTGYRFPSHYTMDFSQNGGYAVNLPAGDRLLAMNFGNVLDTLKLSAVLTASENEGLAKTIARPSITTINNESATISSGDQIPYLVDNGDQGDRVEFKSANTSLNVTPHITNDNWISMDISATRDFPGENYTDAGAAIRTNQATTKVLVKDGDTLVIGGLNESNHNVSTQSVPWLGKVPILGWLFKNDKRTASFTDLLFFITPQILEEGEQLTRSDTF